MCLCMPGQLFPRCKSSTRGIPRHKGLKKLACMRWKSYLELGMDFRKTNQGKDKARKEFVRKEIYLSAEIVIIHFAPLLKELQEEEGRV